MANSIRNNLSYDDIISSIKLTINHPLNKDTNFVIVEGIDDRKFISFFVDENVQVYESFSGKKGVLEIVEYFDIKNVIGICDKDYDEHPPHKIFFYDYCNLEIMLINEDDVLKKIINEMENNFESLAVFRRRIFESLKSISLLRRYNYLELDICNRVKFSNGIVDFSYDSANKNLDLLKLEIHLKETNQGKDCSWFTNVINDCTIYDLREITNGHDATKIMSFLTNMKHDILCVALRCAFSKEHFSRTKLYNQLCVFQADNNLDILKL